MTNPVIQIVQHLRPGGIECMVLDLAARSRRPTFIVSLEGGRDETLKAWPRLRPVADRLVFLGKTAGLSLSVISRLARLLRQMNASAVHTHHIGPLLYGGLAARLAGIRRVIHTEHDAWHLADPRRRRLERTLLFLVRPVLVADSAMVARSMREALGDRPMATIDNGIDTHRFRPAERAAARAALNLPQTVPIVGTAARLEPVKGVDLLIEAAAKIDGIHVAVAGDGSQRSALEAQARASGIADRVHFLGRIDSMAAYYPALNRFCLSSRHEGLPLSLLEAQSCDIPAIVTPVGAMPDGVAPDNGKVAAGVSAEAVAEAIRRSLIAAPNVGPRSHVERHFSLDTMLSAYEELWHDGDDARQPDLATA